MGIGDTVSFEYAYEGRIIDVKGVIVNCIDMPTFKWLTVDATTSRGVSIQCRICSDIIKN